MSNTMLFPTVASTEELAGARVLAAARRAGLVRPRGVTLTRDVAQPASGRLYGWVALVRDTLPSA